MGNMKWLLILLIIPGVYSMTQGINYYDSFQDRPIIIPNKSLQLLGIMDDMGIGGGSGYIGDIDNDGTPEYINPDYNGYVTIWNSTGIINGLYEGKSKDLGTFLYGQMSFHLMGEPPDNDGDGYLEFLVHDYGSPVTLEVWEWNGSVFEYTNLGDITGNSRTEPIWCDVDSDGDMDAFHCEYSGADCKLYTYNGGSYALNTTLTFSGRTFHYNTGPRCGDLDNDGNINDILLTSYDGYFYLLEGQNSHPALVQRYVSSDLGEFWMNGAIGDFLGEGYNLFILCEDSFPCWIYNGTDDLTSPDLIDTSAGDYGYFIYGSGDLFVLNDNGKDQVFTSTPQNDVVRLEMVTPTYLGVYEIGEEIGGVSYSPIYIINDSDAYYIISSAPNGASFDTPILYKRTGTNTWVEHQIIGNFENDVIHGDYAQYRGGYVMNGWTCGNLDTTNPDIECLFQPFSGYIYYFGLYNITEYRADTSIHPQLTVLDIMPTDATRWLNPDDGLVYCINEDRNMILNSVSGATIPAWATAYDDNYNALQNNAIDNGLVSTAENFNRQLAVDYGWYGAGTPAWFEWNSSVPIQIGQIKFWSYIHSHFHPQDLTIEIAGNNCADSPSFITVYNQSTANYITAAYYPGLTVRFIPQDVSCIRVSATGYCYDGASCFTTQNYFSELQAFYGNNCTFYTVGTDFLNSQIGESYNISYTIYALDEDESPNYFDNNLQTAERATASWLLSIVDRITEILRLW